MKLHLGCGEIHLEGWTNIDVRKTSGTDRVEDISTLASIEKGSVDTIYACHVLEHFGLNHQPTVQTVLNRWVELLKPGGEIFISVPNLLALLKGIEHYQNELLQTFDLLKAAYGGQEYPTNVHYCGFTPQYLISLMTQAGLSQFQPFKPFVKDTSQFVLHGVWVSLNLKGVKA
jgi:2-polyprenyl-3-methyl-5-hydroxy-6-metoxy-1,4-benzoquinol methylase